MAESGTPRGRLQQCRCGDPQIFAGDIRSDRIVEMTGGRTGRVAQQTKLDKYTRPKTPAPDPPTEAAEGHTGPDHGGSGEPSLTDIMSAIRGIQETLEHKMDSISIEVNLLRADFGKMKDRARENQGAVASLQTENKELKRQLQELQH